MTAGKGGIGGAADDGGVEYRRGVAAYAVAHGLAGVPLQGFGRSGQSTKVVAVSLETDDPVDDVRIEFADGMVSYVQAKRTLTKGKPFNGAVEQWVRAAQQGLTPGRDHLVICAASASGPLQTLRQLLRRLKTDEPGDLTAGEQKELNYLKHRLPLEDEQLDAVLKCASIHLLDVEETDGDGAREAALLLRDVVEDPEHAGRAWRDLVGAAGGVARVRGGFRMAGWLNLLRDAGHGIGDSGGTPAAALEAEWRATKRYVEQLRRKASTFDLRPLGAEIEPVPISEMDADVEVRDPDGDLTLPIIWPVLRRGRIILTGLPGSGKSTALSRLAAQLTEFDGRLPLLASLRDIDALPSTQSFRDRLLEVGLRDVPDPDRDWVRARVSARLEHGDAVVLLDGLDETYARRGVVVSQVEEFLSDCPDDLSAVVATRDVAYGQASTLGWPAYRLQPPRSIERTITAVLKACFDAASAQGDFSADEADWMRSREDWVAQALRSNTQLKETALLPVFLALLAGERDVQQLPEHRAEIVQNVIVSLVERRMLGTDDLVVGLFNGLAAVDALLAGFRAQARALLDGNGQTSRHDAKEAVIAALRERWGLQLGPATVAAEHTIRFWDDHGIFVATGATQTVAARVALFAEVGDALAAVDEPTRLDEWVGARSAAGALEPLVLAAGLSAVAAEELAAAAVENGDRSLLHACVQAHEEGAQFASEALAAVAAALVEDVAAGDHEGWESLRLLLRLPPESVATSAALDAAKAFSGPHVAIAHAAIDLWTQSRAGLIEDPSTLLAALAAERPPALKGREPSNNNDRRFLMADRLYSDTLVRCAEVLIGAVEEATELVADRIGQVSVATSERLSQLLQEAGMGDRVPNRSRGLAVAAAQWMKSFDPEAPMKLLTAVANLEAPKELSLAERTRLDQLADLADAIDLNDTSSLGREVTSRLTEILDLVTGLGSFDRSLLAAQAQVALERVEWAGSQDPVYALLDSGSAPPLDNWDAVSDPEQAVDLLVEMMRWGLGSARLAASCLWGAPIADLAAPQLRDAMPRLASSTEHLRVAAYALASLAEEPEPSSWLGDDDPVLRAVAAEWADPVDDDGRVAAALVQLLQDEDRNVRAAAVRRVGESSAADRDDVLTRVADEPEPGWTCLSCRTRNDAGRTSCSKDGCFRAPDHLADEARRFLDGGPDASA